MNIEICIPAFNEERIIDEAARTVVRILQEAGISARVTVIDNASTDKTAEIAQKILGVSVVSAPIKGKGAAVVAAAKQTTADMFGFIDSDLSADPTEIISLLKSLERNECDIVVGSRLVDRNLIRRGMARTILSRLFNVLRKLLVGIDVEDTQCGLKLMNRHGIDLLAQCRETGWFFDMEFLARAERSGLRIQEVAIRWDEKRFPGRVSKLSYARDGWGALNAMLRIRRTLRALSMPPPPRASF